MTLFENAAHYVAYGATDQETLRELRGAYSGVLVPGTLAAFQQQGTGGFVLSLSGSLAAVPYSIDPRFPLFQQQLVEPKKSHLALAEAFGDHGLVNSDRAPRPEDFDSQRLARLAQAWTNFNLGYKSASSAKFDKYAKRLGEAVSVSTARSPSIVLAPYFLQLDDAWAECSRQLFRFTEEAVGARLPVAPVVAVAETAILNDAVAAARSSTIAIWVSNLNELSCTAPELQQYYAAIRTGASHGKKLFALYGGFSTVLAMSLGLRGFSHGIGYGEYRNWRELPSSGPPPARYYAPALHRFLRQDVAQSLYHVDPTLAACACSVCDGRPPLLLDYHELMQHSVLVRHQEIETYAALSPPDAHDLLLSEIRQLRTRIGNTAPLIRNFFAQPGSLWQHLDVAATAFGAAL
jgi:hypothetical protein